MTQLRATLLSAVCLVLFSFGAHAQEDGQLIIDASKEGEFTYDPRTGMASYTNGVLVRFGGGALSADKVSINDQTGDIIADGKVHIQQNDMLWAGEHVLFNFKTRQIVSEEFRAGKSPVFAEGMGLHGFITNNSPTNQLYFATNSFITGDDYAKPAYRIRAQRIKLIPGKRIEAYNATLWLGDVPVFYFPYYSRNLGDRANNYTFTPGYRSLFGPFLLNTYTWFLGEELDGRLHLDYREKKGVGAGSDFNLHLGRWGESTFRYYYTRDDDPGTNRFGKIPDNRQRFYFSYQATPWTNLNVKALVRWQSDSDLIKQFFESEYRQDPQQNTFVEVNKFWRNWSLDVLTMPRLMDFYENVERLPDIRLSGFRQQVGATPLYYESESSVGYYRRRFAETNLFASSLNYEAGRFDSFHQLTLPETFFGWLNFIPRAGVRLDYYGAAHGPGAPMTEDGYRGVFNTGAEVNFKASRVWPGVDNRLLDLDGVRHIIVPSVNYVFVPTPNRTPGEVPQFDFEHPSLRLLPIEFPEYNAIDSIDSQNVMRFGLNNKMQTKRHGEVEDFLAWELMLDWRLHPRPDQQTFADLYSNLQIKPRSWLTLDSQTRFDPNDRRWRMLLHTLTFEPNNVWSWTIGHLRLRDDFSGLPTQLGEGNNQFISTMFYRLNENWGFRSSHTYDLRNSRMLEQYYTVYRDLRSWTAAITAGLRDNGNGPKDFVISFSFSLKAMPHYALGSDTVRPHTLLGR
jgi:LPS-assembly protein